MTLPLLILFAATLVQLEIMVALQPWLRRYTSDGLESARAGSPPEGVTPDIGVLVNYGNLTDLARHPRDSEVVRRQAASFAFPVFQSRFATALS